MKEVGGSAASVVRLVTIAALFWGGGTVAWSADRWWIWLPVWGIQSWLLLAVTAGVHEASHLHLVRGRSANRWLGTVLGLLLFSVAETYRTQHILHHADTCGEADTEGAPYRFTARWHYVAAFLGGGLIYAATMVGQSVRVAFGCSPPWLRSASQRSRIRVNLAVWVAYVVGFVVVAVTWPRPVVMLWLVPVVLCILGPLPFVLIPEHYGAVGPGPATTNTRTCRSNAFVRFVYLNTNLHTAHHQQPAVPWQQLTSVPTGPIDPGWAHTGYLAFHRSAWRSIHSVPSAAA